MWRCRWLVCWLRRCRVQYHVGVCINIRSRLMRFNEPLFVLNLLGNHRTETVAQHILHVDRTITNVGHCEIFARKKSHWSYCTMSTELIFTEFRQSIYQNVRVTFHTTNGPAQFGRSKPFAYQISQLFIHFQTIQSNLFYHQIIRAGLDELQPLQLEICLGTLAVNEDISNGIVCENEVKTIALTSPILPADIFNV